MKKTQISSSDIENIIHLYLKENLGTHSISKIYKISHKKVSEILKNNNITIKKKGGQVKDDLTKILPTYKIKKFLSPTNKSLILICKKTGKTFNDINNLSGSLTSHIKKTYPNVNIPKNYYERKKIDLKIGKKWYEEFFEIKEIDIPIKRKCRICDWETTDINNFSGSFESHIKNTHNETIDNYLSKFPMDITYHKNYIKEKNRKNNLKLKNKSVKCEICNKKFYSISHTHLKKHNITQEEYKLKYETNLISENLKQLYSDNMSRFNELGLTTKKYGTKPENEISSFLLEYGINHEKNNRSILNGKEIDILIPNKKIGIEMNGNIHHTEFFGGKNRNYHLSKIINSNKKGYKLLHIFSDEWENKKNIIKSKILHILNSSKSIKIGARKCKIKEISLKEKNEFLEKYHLQGSDTSSIKLGAFYKDVLVGVMTFKKQSNYYELTRFASNYDYIIIGLGSKILSFFIKSYKPSKIISFADRRWTTDMDNNLYTKMGFKLSNILKPDYRYINLKHRLDIRHHKFGFRKKGLLRKYPNLLNENMTETEMIKILGYDRIWDCGLFKYEINL